MSAAARSIQVFSFYLAVLAATLLAAPNLLLGAFAMPATEEVWIRVVGMLVAFLSVYYSAAARTEDRAFFTWTVPVRLSVPVFFGAFVALCDAPPALMLFAGADALSAGWTWSALRRERPRPS